ncbi:MAG: hypothetical protein RL514_3171 [Verrucomicrobiota bacterium]|jgi:hypothetical protein
MADRSRSAARIGGKQAGQLAFVGLAFAMAGWLFYSHFMRPDFKVNKRPFASLGEFAADELVKILPTGRVQVVYDVSNQAAGEDPRLGKALEMQAVQAHAFKTRLAGRGKFSFEPDVKLPRSAMAMGSAWPGGTFQSLAKASDTTLVLFSSLPALGEAERALTRQRAGKLVVVGMGLPEIQPAVQAQLVQLAIAYRVPVPKSSAAVERPTEWVQRVYAVVTPEGRPP